MQHDVVVLMAAIVWSFVSSMTAFCNNGRGKATKKRGSLRRAATTSVVNFNSPCFRFHTKFYLNKVVVEGNRHFRNLLDLSLCLFVKQCFFGVLVCQVIAVLDSCQL